MKFEVILSAQALDDLEEAYEWLLGETPLHAPDWHNALVDAMVSLESFPRRCQVAPENESSTEETRHLLFGNRRHAYRVIFTIRETKVWVFHILHAARNPHE